LSVEVGLCNLVAPMLQHLRAMGVNVGEIALDEPLPVTGRPLNAPSTSEQQHQVELSVWCADPDDPGEDVLDSTFSPISASPIGSKHLVLPRRRVGAVLATGAAVATEPRKCDACTSGTGAATAFDSAAAAVSDGDNSTSQPLFLKALQELSIHRTCQTHPDCCAKETGGASAAGRGQAARALALGLESSPCSVTDGPYGAIGATAMAAAREAVVAKGWDPSQRFCTEDDAESTRDRTALPVSRR